MEETILGVTLAAQAVLFGLSAVSLWLPRHRVWPPPRRWSWQFFAIWFLSWLTLSGAFLLAVFGENDFGLPLGVRLGAGVPLLLLGGFLVAWGMGALRLHATLGFEGQLIRSGPYGLSRNPQYVGTVVYLASLVALSGSAPTAVACVAIALWFLASPFVEEPWLRERYGEAYEAYRRAVPRYLGVRGLRERRCA